MRWHATDGRLRDSPVLMPAAASRIESAEADPRTVDLSGIIAVFCASAGEIGDARGCACAAAGLPVNVMDDPAHSSFIFPAIVDRGDVVVADRHRRRITCRGAACSRTYRGEPCRRGSATWRL